MNRFFYDSFQEYLCSRGIKKVDFMLKNNETLNRNILEQKVNKQLYVIKEVHDVSCGFNGYLRKRINNHTCKYIEEEKVRYKKFCRAYEKLKETGPDNNIEEVFLSNGDYIIERGKECFEKINDNNYMDLVRRSMERVEICLTDVDFDNLGKNDTIEIVNFEDIAYNMIEMDCYYFLSKLKRKGFNVDFNKSVDTFCNIENLDDSSAIFIRSLLSYPHEFLKFFEKYKKNKKNWNEDEYIRRLINGIREDEKSLI
ncbi:MAG: hypothetical protein E6929_09380 [Clostridium sp.]|nr:hypothetical protein [Clostridium sp.]